VDLGAPGVDIWSTVPLAKDTDGTVDGYGVKSGTSMATPHVAGVAALAFAYRPFAQYPEVRNALLHGVDAKPSMAGVTVSGGRLNAFNTLNLLAGLQDQMRVIDSSPSSSTPVSTAITDFTVRFSNPVEASTLQASDFSITKTGGAAVPSNFAPTVSSTDPALVTFHYSTSPVNVNEISSYTMSIAAGSIQRTTSGTPAPADLVSAWSDTFGTQKAVTVPSGELALTLPDLKTTTATLTVNQPNTVVRDVNVRLNITQKYDADLSAYLVSPKGTRVELFTKVGRNGNNFGTSTIDTRLDDEATTLITSGTAPFAGNYRPKGSLASIDGEAANGTWKLELYDAYKGNVGTLRHWALELTLAGAPAAAAAVSGATVASHTVLTSSALSDRPAIATTASLLDPQKGDRVASGLFGTVADNGTSQVLM
jgi:subtilisin-like proprotein convertase family protein